VGISGWKVPPPPPPLPAAAAADAGTVMAGWRFGEAGEREEEEVVVGEVGGGW
jgi:hypothetical protein